MTKTSEQSSIQTIEVIREQRIEAPPDAVFEAVLAEMGPEGQMPDGTPFPMKIEPRPGGRWYRDLGNDAGHFWGHVQVIKPPGLLEVCGPMFMSYPAVSHVQYRLTAEGDGTRLKITHRAMGLIPQEHRQGMEEGWDHTFTRVRELVARRAGIKH